MFNILAVLIVMLTIFIASSMGSEQQDISPILGEISDWNSLINTLASIKSIFESLVGRGVSFLVGNPILSIFIMLMIGLLVFFLFYRMIPTKGSFGQKGTKSFIYTTLLFLFLGVFLIALRSDMTSELIRAFVSFETVRSVLLYIDFTYAGTPVNVQNLGVEGFLEFIIRKFAHFFLFSLLGFFLYLVIYKYSRREIVSVLFTVLFIIGYAALDVYRQSFIPTRSALKEDVILDTAGGIFGVGMAILKSSPSSWFSKRRSS